MPSNRLEEIRERVEKEMLRCQTHRYVKANEPGYGKEPVCQDIPYLLERLRLAEAVVKCGQVVREIDLGFDEPMDEHTWNLFKSALTAYDAFLSGQAGGGK